MRTCLVVQHEPPEEPYAIGRALEAAGVTVSLSRMFAADRLPDGLDGLSGLVVMGGPMSAYRDEGFPWRRAELSLLARALETGLPVLGVCLGAQMLAAAAGADVYPGAAGTEIGWRPVHVEPAVDSDPLLSGWPDTLDVLHWHGDTFDLPAGSAHLALSASYASQAFRVGARAWGLQFHIEVDDEGLARFIDAFGDQLTSSGTSPDELRRQTHVSLPALAHWRDLALGRFAALVAGHRVTGRNSQAAPR